MAVESALVPLGSTLPEMSLPSIDGQVHSFAGLRGTGVLVVMFSANHCPYVQHVEKQISALAAEFADRGVQFVAVGSNDVVAYPDDDVAGLQDQASRAGWQFPYLIDTEQLAAREFGAVCTPDFFVYDINGVLAYRGALDGSTPKNGVPLTGDDLRLALTLLIVDKPVPQPHRPSLGCSIKWRD